MWTWEVWGGNNSKVNTTWVSLIFYSRCHKRLLFNVGGMASWEDLSRIKGKHTMIKPFAGLPLNWEKLNSWNWITVRRRILICWSGLNPVCIKRWMHSKEDVLRCQDSGEKNGISGPIKMYNRDNAAAADIEAGTAAAKCAENCTQGGAIKVSSLAGAVFRHKDQKHG